MKKYLYEAIITPNELGGFDARFPDFGIITQGDSFSDTAFMAQDLLTTWISAELEQGTNVATVGVFSHECPEGSTLIGIATYAEPTIAFPHTMTVQEAADILDVSTSRIHAMIRSDILRTEKIGTSRLVVTEDVMNYFNNPRSAGRPKKIATA